ncbi:MAG: hypothetical protein HN392_13780 [Anaerolineae bacterium]|jgi:hypothetical protein|nr:hypothetical protein [Anaerolineae bacterium]
MSETEKTSKISQGVISFLKENLLNLFIGTFIALAIFYFLERKEIEPRYSISGTELLAEQLENNNNLKLFWDGKEIQNIRSIEIAIWNAGKQIIKKDDISETKPIRIIIPPGLDVLYADFIKTSRPNELTFSTSHQVSDDNIHYIKIEIVGDEAIEENDGGIVKVLFTGESDERFSVSGRIFGSKDGFRELAWFVSKESRDFVLILYVMAFGSIYIAYLAFRFLYPKYKSQPNSFKKYLMALGILLIIGTLLWGSVASFAIMKEIPMKKPPWLP